jgi:hypothetical protein
MESLKQQIMGASPELSGRMAYAAAEDGVIADGVTDD